MKFYENGGFHMKRVYSAVLFTIFSLSTLSSQAMTFSSVLDTFEKGLRSGLINYWHYPITMPAKVAWNVAQAAWERPVLATTLAVGVTAESAIRHYLTLDMMDRAIERSVSYNKGYQSFNKNNFKFATWKLDTWTTGQAIKEAPHQSACIQLWLDVNALGNQSPVIIKNDNNEVIPSGCVFWSDILQALKAEVREFEGKLNYLENFSPYPDIFYQLCVNDGVLNLFEEFEPLSGCAQALNNLTEQQCARFFGDAQRKYDQRTTSEQIKSNLMSCRFWYYPWNARIMTWEGKASDLYLKLYKYYLRLRVLVEEIEKHTQRKAYADGADHNSISGIFDLYTLIQRRIISKVPADQVSLNGKILGTLQLVLDPQSRFKDTIRVVAGELRTAVEHNYPRGVIH
jgi:hypothetical protein